MPKRKSRMFSIRNGFGALVCIMRTKRIAITCAEAFTGQSWKDLKADGFTVERVTVEHDAPRADFGRLLHEEGEADLWGCFSRGQTWVTLPRALMHEMPDDWKGRFAELLDEWDSAWSWPADFPSSRVQAVGEGNRFTSWPRWLLEYKFREQYRDEIEAIRGSV